MRGSREAVGAKAYSRDSSRAGSNHEGRVPDKARGLRHFVRAHRAVRGCPSHPALI
ncbi:hypothetical protein BGLA2_2750006 [Burkholderia gladioli]|nr:hypothetical protein BGLA2_2750006 [Burkholderia gladioli]